MKQILAFSLIAVLFFSCEKESTTTTAPNLPPFETMVIDFGKFSNPTKSAEVTNTNWLFSAVTVGAWSVILETTFAVPVAAFHSAINTQPKAMDDLTWQWEYAVEGFTSQYTARLVGKLLPKGVQWEMYITKTGIQAFSEFLWFQGISSMDGKSGQWILYHSAAYPEKTIQIDWKKDGEKVGEIKYTYVRENNNQGQKDTFNGSTLAYGLQDQELDIFVNVHAYSVQEKGFNDSFIVWSSKNYNGHVKAQNFYNDSNWHCWDSKGSDVDCN